MNIAIDDFGTGLSSPAYLKRPPIDKIKIDRSFVSDVGEAGEDVAIGEAIVGRAAALKKEIVAEGIETRQQLSAIQPRHAQHGQGFFFSRPVPPEDIAPLVCQVKQGDFAEQPSSH